MTHTFGISMQWVQNDGGRGPQAHGLSLVLSDRQMGGAGSPSILGKLPDLVSGPVSTCLAVPHSQIRDRSIYGIAMDERIYHIWDLVRYLVSALLLHSRVDCY